MTEARFNEIIWCLHGIQKEMEAAGHAFFFGLNNGMQETVSQTGNPAAVTMGAEIIKKMAVDNRYAQMVQQSQPQQVPALPAPEAIETPEEGMGGVVG